MKTSTSNDIPLVQCGHLHLCAVLLGVCNRRCWTMSGDSRSAQATIFDHVFLCHLVSPLVEATDLSKLGLGNKSLL